MKLYLYILLFIMLSAMLTASYLSMKNCQRKQKSLNEIQDSYDRNLTRRLETAFDIAKKYGEEMP